MQQFEKLSPFIFHFRYGHCGGVRCFVCNVRIDDHDERGDWDYPVIYGDGEHLYCPECANRLSFGL